MAERRLGLALSGGGFRASLFHVGVLARLADLGLLRHVEAISTVSGGSIIGALFYLYLKALLEKKSDDEINDADYQRLVAELLGHFLRVVQLNLRMRTFRSFSKNLMMFLPSYSRSDHIGELYDQHLYRPAFGGDLGRMVEMREIKEGTAIYYLGEFRVTPPDTLKFTATVEVAGEPRRELVFNQKFYK